MKPRRWLQRLVCPSCLPAEPIDRHPVLVILERSAEALDRLRFEVREIRKEMAGDDNPVLGRPPRVPRRKQP